MAMMVLVPLDLGGSEIRNFAFQSLASPPENPVLGQGYFDSTQDRPRMWNGSEWVDMVGADGTVTSVSGVAPIQSTGGATPEISIDEATPTDAGSMSASDKAKLDDIDDEATANESDAYLLDREHHTGSQDIDTVSGLQAALDDKQDTSEKDQPDGYAGLDSEGKIASNQLPSLAITETFVVADITARDELDPNQGDVAIVTDRGDGEPATYIWDGNEWVKVLSPLKGIETISVTGPLTSTGGDTPELGIADESITEQYLAPAVVEALGDGIEKVTQTVGGSTESVITHNLDSRDVVVEVRKTASPYAQVFPGVEMTSADTVTIRFAQAPDPDEYTVTVIG